MNNKILFVDDDSNLLAALKRRLRKQFDIAVAVGPELGLEVIESAGPFAVVVADMRMPGMNGIEFLAHVKEMSPDTVRMMLTGNADMQTAIDAVNEGNIFRFLTKPCPQSTMVTALESGLEQYRLVNAERELLENTLMGSLKMLSEILSLVNPLAFSRATRVRRYVQHIGTQRGTPPGWWQFEVAALLSQIGCVTLTADMLDKVYAQVPLSEDEQQMYATHPTVAYNLLNKIPRLEPIAKMVANQQKPFYMYPAADTMDDEEKRVAFGGQILKVVLDFDQLVINGLPKQEALSRLRQHPEEYNAQLVANLSSVQMEKMGDMVKMLRVKQLKTGMVADNDIRAQNGLLLVPKGQEITYPVLERLRNFARQIGIVEPMRVLVHEQHELGG
ncbi:MAG: response regulator [Chloroflexi bacterium]|nr:MAG: response regulator [Chloroflexota bacterium]